MKKQEKGRFGGVRDVRPYESSDIRFTARRDSLYAFFMDTPQGDIRITSLGKNSGLADRKLKSVSMLGSEEKLKWKQEADALVIQRPAEFPDWKVTGFRIVFKK
jgi:alpha-L-fucosidase